MNRQRPWLRRLFSLRVRTTVLVILAVLPALALTLRLIGDERRIVKAEVQQGALRLARSLAADQERVIEATRQLLVALSQLPELQELDGPACSRTFARLVNQLPFYNNLGVALPDGTIFCSGLPPERQVSIADRDYFRAALRGRGLAVSGFLVPRIGQRPSLHLAYPVVAPDGEIRAVVFAAFALEALSRELGLRDLPEGSTILILDRDDRVLVRMPHIPGAAGEDVSNSPLGRMARGYPDTTAEGRGLDGVERLYGIASLPGAVGAATDLRVVVGIPRDAAFREVDRMHRESLFLLGLAGLLVVAAAWIGGEFFVIRPVRALVRATRRLAAGDLTARTGLTYGFGAGEISELARSFDDMAASLQARAKELGAMGGAARSVVQEQDLAGTARAVVDQARSALATDQAALWLAEGAESRLKLIAHVGVPESALHLFESIPFDAMLPPARAARTNHPVIVEDLLRETTPSGEQVLAREAGARSTLDLPLSYRGRLVGVLGLFTALPHRFGPEELRLASALGDLFAAAVENARLYAEVREALRLRDEFLGAAAHELRTPATVMRAHAQLLGREDGDEHRRRLLAGIQGAAARTSRLARELLEAHTLTRQPERLDLRPADLLELIADAVAAAATTSPRHRFLVCAAGPVPVVVDRERLALAIDSLLENAARYQPTGGTVRIFVHADEETATVEVRDFGVGIRAERLGYVFEPLFEPWPPGSPHYVGVAGMGLHLARRIVEAHGGTIAAESRLGEGSVFRFSIPRRLARPAVSPPPPS